MSDRHKNNRLAFPIDLVLFIEYLDVIDFVALINRSLIHSTFIFFMILLIFDELKCFFVD